MAIPGKLRELFSDNPLQEESPLPAQGGQAPGIVWIPPERLDPYDEHVFKPYSQERLRELADDIAENGVISPIYVRPRGDRYQILAGHNRTSAAKLAGLLTVPCVVKECDDDTAALIVVNTNLYQRENMLPSEKAFAYKRQMEILKKRGKNIEKFTLNPDDDAENQEKSPLETKQESRANIFRYIRLTYLMPELLERVDEQSLPFRAGAELSYLPTPEQSIIHEYFFIDKRGALDIKTAQLLRSRSREAALTYESIDKLLRKSKPPATVTSYRVPYKKIAQYIPPDTSKREVEKRIIEALAFYYEHHKED